MVAILIHCMPCWRCRWFGVGIQQFHQPTVLLAAASGVARAARPLPVHQILGGSVRVDGAERRFLARHNRRTDEPQPPGGSLPLQFPGSQPPGVQLHQGRSQQLGTRVLDSFQRNQNPGAAHLLTHGESPVHTFIT